MNKYLEKIASLTEKELNRESWKGLGYSALGGTAGALTMVPGVNFVGSGIGLHQHMKRLGKEHDLKAPTVGRSAKGLVRSTIGSTVGTLAGGATGGTAGATIGGLLKGKAGARVGGLIGGIAGAVPGSLYGAKEGVKSNLRRYIEDSKK